MAKGTELSGDWIHCPEQLSSHADEKNQGRGKQGPRSSLNEGGH